MNSVGFRATRKLTTGSQISLIPNSGLAISGITTSSVIGIYFTLYGISIYNTSVGTSVIATASFPNTSSYQAIFDEYRINKVTIEGYFSNNTSNVSSTATSIPVFYTCTDFDYSSPPTSANGVLTYSTSRAHQANSIGKPVFSRTLIPRAIVDTSASFLGAVIPGLMPERTWMDSSYSTSHYGFFICYDPQGGTQATSEGYLSLILSTEFEYRGNR